MDFSMGMGSGHPAVQQIVIVELHNRRNEGTEHEAMVAYQRWRQIFLFKPDGSACGAIQRSGQKTYIAADKKSPSPEQHVFAARCENESILNMERCKIRLRLLTYRDHWT
jgi:hypothetical protein